MARVFVLTTSANGELFSSVHPSKGDAINSLNQFVEASWDGEIIGSAYEDFPPEDAREIFLDSMGCHCIIEERSVDLEPMEGAADVYLTPGMCGVIKNALGQFPYKKAREILDHHGEIKAEGKSGDIQAAAVIDKIMEQL